MKKLVSIFIRYPFYANMIIALLVIGGLYSFFNLDKSFFPERSERFINISVFYPGASPKEMEEIVESSGLTVVEHLIDPVEIDRRYVPEHYRGSSAGTIGTYGGFLLAKNH